MRKLTQVTAQSTRNIKKFTAHAYAHDEISQETANRIHELLKSLQLVVEENFTPQQLPLTDSDESERSDNSELTATQRRPRRSILSQVQRREPQAVS